MTIQTITTADNVKLYVGDYAFNFYDMRKGYIGKIDSYPQPDTNKGQDSNTPMSEWNNYWFDFVQDQGRTCLDGSRICSLEFAKGKGWLK